MTVVVGLTVGAERYALPVEHVREVGDLGDVTPVPGSGAAVLGVRNLRGRILPVFDLARVLGIEGAARGRLVVAAVGDTAAGLAVDDVTDVGELTAGGDHASDLLAATALVDGVLVGILDVPRLFAALEATAA